MAKQTINIGDSVNDRSGDPLRTAFGKVNSNFTEVYNAVANVLPDQTGNNGKVLTTDGTTVSWQFISADYVSSINDFGEGFSLNGANKIVTNKLYSTNQTNSAQHYRLELDTNGVVHLPDQSVINGATLRVVPGTGALNYAALAAGPDLAHPEDSWLWVDYNGAWVGTDYSGTAYTWQFTNGGSLIFPDGLKIDSSVISRRLESPDGEGISAVGSKLTLTDNSITMEGYTDPNGLNNNQYGRVVASGGGVELSFTAEEVGGSIETILNLGGGVSILTTDGVLSSTWHFDMGGLTRMPGDLELTSVSSLTQNYSYTRTSNLQITSPNVIWSSLFSYTSSAKLTIQVEVAEVGDNTGWHVQTCEAVISSRGYANGVNGYGEPVMTVYGVTYTSTAPLMTFSVGRNPINNSIEVIGTQTAAASGSPSLRIHSVEMATSD